jgi:hypothetical protein
VHWDGGAGNSFSKADVTAFLPQNFPTVCLENFQDAFSVHVLMTE